VLSLVVEHPLQPMPRVPSGELTPESAAIDTDTGPVTAVDVGFALMTPFSVGRAKRDTTPALAFAPTPRVEISAGLERERVLLASRILGGRYRLGRQLGAGGYGAVYAAEDTISGERVAIKLLSPAASQSHELVIRFHREAIAASRIRHPHIVNVADFDVDEDDGHFIVMEHLDGRDLAQTLAEVRTLAPLRALTIAAQCARGLAAAHRVGVLHRDLKPGNVFLVRKDGGGESVKVIDFGISKLTQIAGDYTDVTSSSKVVGTPSYMSPEQARGAVLDARTDVYALGVMLFEMLVGERPFTGRSPIEIIGNHMSAPRVAPSALRPELADYPGLDDLVLRAIASAPDQRFASMASLADALVACIRTIAPAAADHVTEPTGEQTPRAHSDREVTSPIVRATPRWLLIALVVAIVASVAAIVWSSRTSEKAAPHEVITPAVKTPPVLESPPPPPPPTSREITITSSPSGADVYRGDARIGVTPLTITLEPTERSLKVVAPGYRAKSIVVRDGEDQVDVVLTAKRAPKPPPRTTPSVRGVADW
jgi:eukaryotic-like serine/threonine-protein kinase